MYLFKISVREFIEKADNLWKEVAENFKREFGYNASPSEINSWKNSYPKLASMLRKTNQVVKNSILYLEYGMPSSSARADAILVGLNKESLRTAVVIELKQWDANSILIQGNNLKVRGILFNHPSDQALSYCDFLSDLSFAFSDLKAIVAPCSYLFNSNSHSLDKIRINQFSKITKLAPIFAGNEDEEFSEWLNSLIVQQPDSRFISDMENDQPKISKNLYNTVAKSVREEETWILLDEQKTAYNLIKEKIASSNGEKHLILVTGGPGTGKSVIAAQLMGDLCRKKIPTVHITNSSSFTTNMRALISKTRDRIWGSTAVKGLFRLSHNWIRRKDSFDVAICDEAHRFRSKTTLYPYLVSDRPQVEEIFENVNIMIAFIDEKQRLRVAEEGTVSNFKKWATNSGVKSENIYGPIELKVQFRCAGNEDFVKVLDTALFNSKAIGFFHKNFELNIHSSPQEMEEHLQNKIKLGSSARIVAGFCWEWSDPDENGNLISDVKIADWERPWNRKATGKESAINHPYTLWTNRRNNQLSEVGCIYSVQGFEFDYIGVIWGNDLVFRDGSWIHQKFKSYDREYKRKIDSETITNLLKNAYRVLLSRGIKGCSIYCMDKETKEFLESALLKSPEYFRIESDISTQVV